MVVSFYSFWRTYAPSSECRIVLQTEVMKSLRFLLQRYKRPTYPAAPDHPAPPSMYDRWTQTRLHWVFISQMFLFVIHSTLSRALFPAHLLYMLVFKTSYFGSKVDLIQTYLVIMIALHHTAVSGGFMKPPQGSTNLS